MRMALRSYRTAVANGCHSILKRKQTMSTPLHSQQMQDQPLEQLQGKMDGANASYHATGTKRMTMSLQKFLEPAYLLQTTALALSIFNLVAFLWLASTVWLNGNRKSGIARLGVVGLSLSALFFFVHALLIPSPVVQSSGLVTREFLWHLIWLPAFGVPY